MEKFEFEGRIITEKDNREKYLTTAAANYSHSLISFAVLILNSSFKKFFNRIAAANSSFLILHSSFLYLSLQFGNK